METVKTAISIQKPLFERAEELARKLKVSRSRLFALALEEYIRRQENQEMLERINAAYGDGPDPEEEAWLRFALDSQRRLVEDEW